MGDESDGGRMKFRIASRLYVCSEGAMKLSNTMKVDGYTTPDRRGRYVPTSLFRRHEYIKKIQKETDVPLTVVLDNGTCTNNFLFRIMLLCLI